MLFWCRKTKLEQLERLPSENTPHRLMITHTIESYWIPSQKKTKSKLQILRICQKFNGRTDGQTDKVIPVYPPINFVEARGITRCTIYIISFQEEIVSD